MALEKGGNTLPRIAKAEHIGPTDTGDNIEAKRVAGYVWNPATSEWERDGADVLALAIRLDDTTTPGIIYIGKAAVATDTSADLWQVCSLDVSSGLIKTWADGDALFDNIWDDRASLTYL